MITQTLGERVAAALKGIGRPTDFGYNTRQLKQALTRCEEGEERGVFPPVFIIALRQAVESGLTCEQITASLILMSGVSKLRHADEERICCSAKVAVQAMINDLGQ